MSLQNNPLVLEKKIQEYFVEHPKLMMSFVGFNAVLKMSNKLSSEICYSNKEVIIIETFFYKIITILYS